jgi:predicted transposase YdaD
MPSVTLAAMKTDAQCNVLARLRPEDLLVLVGDPGAQVLSTNSVELREIKRTVDVVLKLKRGRTIYYRHLEFQARRDRTMNRRCFLYDALLLDQYQAPVITTIIYLFPQRQPDEAVFRMKLGQREINRWQFECIRLWEWETEAILTRGLPGLAALVPLLKATEWAHMEQAVQQIETTAPAAQQSDLLAILHALGQRRYTIERLNQIIGKERIMESWIYQEGRTEGLIAGQLANAREFCRKAVRKWHPQAGTKVWKAIDHCTDLAALEDVTLNASEWSTREIVRRLMA